MPLLYKQQIIAEAFLNLSTCSGPIIMTSSPGVKLAMPHFFQYLLCFFFKLIISIFLLRKKISSWKENIGLCAMFMQCWTHSALEAGSELFLFIFFGQRPAKTFSSCLFEKFLQGFWAIVRVIIHFWRLSSSAFFFYDIFIYVFISNGVMFASSTCW